MMGKNTMRILGYGFSVFLILSSTLARGEDLVDGDIIAVSDPAEKADPEADAKPEAKTASEAIAETKPALPAKPAVEEAPNGIDVTANAVKVTGHSDEQKALIAQILEATHMTERIRDAVEEAPWEIRSKIKAGRLYNGYDISTEEFWKKLQADYEKQKPALTESVTRRFHDYFARKYTVEEMRELLKLITSPVWNKMTASMQDPENPGNDYVKALRRDVYVMIREKTQTLKNELAVKAPAGRAPSGSTKNPSPGMPDAVTGP